MKNSPSPVADRPDTKEQAAPSRGDSFAAASCNPAAANPRPGFYNHIADALAINKHRRSIYAQMTGGKSLAVSNLLIGLECMSIPLAMYYDYRAKGFNRQGIPIIAADFMPMDNIRPLEHPPTYRGRADQATLDKVSGLLAAYKTAVGKAAEANDFRQVARDSYDLLRTVHDIESASQSHFYMVRHIVESTGLAALNAVDYARSSKGETNKLSRDFLKLQVMAIGLTVTIDRKAQEVQAMGVGILVNDIPYIPFEEAWQCSPLSRQH